MRNAVEVSLSPIKSLYHPNEALQTAHLSCCLLACGITNHDEPVVMAGYAATAVLSLGLIGAWFGGYINDKIRYPEFVPVVIFLVVAPALYYTSRLMDMPLIYTTALFSLIYYAWQPSQNYLIAKYTKKSSHGMGFGVNFTVGELK